MWLLKPGFWRLWQQRSHQKIPVPQPQKQSRNVRSSDPGRLFVFHAGRSFSQHASHSGFHPSVTRQLWLPLVPLLWRRILLCEAVSDQSHGGQVTELKFRSVPYQRSTHETQAVSLRANTPQQKQRLFSFFLHWCVLNSNHPVKAVESWMLTIRLLELELFSEPNTQHCKANAGALRSVFHLCCQHKLFAHIRYQVPYQVAALCPRAAR